MNEKNINENGPENVETEPVSLTLRNIANDLGFVENPDLQEIGNKVVEDSKSPDAENPEKFLLLWTTIDDIGKEIASHANNFTFDLVRIGLMVTKAALLFECRRIEDCKDEIYDSLTELDNAAAIDHPEVGSIITRLEELYQSLKK